ASSKGNEFSQRCEPKNVQSFSDFGKRCREHLREQLTVRFPEEDSNEAKALLLGPRIKTKVLSIVKDRSLLERAKRELQLEHDELYHKLFFRVTTEEESKIVQCVKPFQGL
ncbi:hypothetical protein L914_12153, partial [Phytophthora nicotianae]